MPKPFVRRSTKPPPRFYKPSVKTNNNGLVTIPETKEVKYTGGSMDKSVIPLKALAVDLVRKYQISEANLADVGERIANDYASIESINKEDLYQQMCLIVEGPAQSTLMLPPEHIMLFRDAWRNHNTKGPYDPNTLRDKEEFSNQVDMHIPDELWYLQPLQAAESALREHIYILQHSQNQNDVDHKEPVVKKKIETITYENGVPSEVRREVEMVEDSMKKSMDLDRKGHPVEHSKSASEWKKTPGYRRWLTAMKRGKATGGDSKDLDLEERMELWKKRYAKKCS